MMISEGLEYSVGIPPQADLGSYYITKRRALSSTSIEGLKNINIFSMFALISYVISD